MGSRISGAELEIMEYLWQTGKASTFSDILNYFNNIKKKDWCKQTLNTYLLRLKKRSLLIHTKEDDKSVYCPKLTQIQYEKMCAEEILKSSYDGILSNFIAALSGRESIEEMDKDELLEYIMKERC